MSKYSYAFCEWYMPITGFAALHLASAAGYDGIQVCDKGGEACGFPMNQQFFQEEYLRAQSETGITLQMFNLLSTIQSGGATDTVDSTRGQALVRATERGASACRVLGIPSLFVPGCLNNQPVDTDSLIRSAIMLERLSKICSNQGIELLYESFMDAPTTLELWERSNGAFRLLYDTLNPIRYGFSSPEKDLASYPTELLACIHVKDGLVGDGEDRPLGSGHGRLSDSTKTLANKGYCGWIVNENNYWSPRYAPVDTSALVATDLQIIKELFSDS